MHSAADAVSANNLGIELLESGHAAAAASAFRSAISFNPLSSAESHYNLGIAFKDMGRHHASVIATRACSDLSSTTLGGLLRQSSGTSRPGLRW